MKPATELTNRLREGNQDALLSLMNLYYNDLFRYGIRYTADKDLTKDIIHQFFLHVWDHRDQFVRTKNLQAYLLVAFRNFLFNYLRRISRQLELPGTEQDPVEYSYEEYIIAFQDDAEVRSALQAAIQSLPERQRELIRLRYYEQLSCEDIARQTSLSIRTVYNKIHEAINKLRSNSLILRLGRSSRSVLLPLFSASTFAIC